MSALTLPPAKRLQMGFRNSLGLLSLLSLAMPGFAPGTLAQTRPSLTIGLTNGLPRLAVTCVTGSLHQLEDTESLASGSVWRVRALWLATNSPWVWVDSTAAAVNARHYRVALLTNSAPPNPQPDSLVWLSPGTFTMGSPESEAERGADETQHIVVLSRGFFIGKNLVPQTNYLALTGANPSYFNGDRSGPPDYDRDYGTDLNRPVERVTWFDATNYCGLLTQQEQAAGRLPSGWRYRLPTEAEWEYACRAGTTTAFAHGDTLLGGMANFDSHYPYDAAVGDLYDPQPATYVGMTTEVGSYPPNLWGLYDMCGNVYGWCGDWYDDYPAGSVTDPQGPASGFSKIIRGGSWNSYGSRCRSAFRFGLDPSYAFDVIGFRVVLAPAQP